MISTDRRHVASFAASHGRSNHPCDGAILLNKAPLISIVDDDSVVRGAIESLVTSLGFLACTFSSAEEFLQSQLMAETACLISDVQLPDTSGVELQHRLDALGLNIPMIFVTAYADDAVRAGALEAGAICFLQKPFDGQSLVQCIDSAVNRRGKKIITE